MALVRFMETNAGRLSRGAAGLILVALGAWLGGAWWVLAAAGLIPLGAGVFNLCLVAPLFGGPLRAAHRA
jgi:membrane-associated protease RseP (regulator of RpoE activity)